MDDLTGLPNRRYLLHALDSLIALEQEFSLLFLDMDGFKRVNDSMGHAEGDAVLERVGELPEKLVDEIAAAAELVIHKA